MAWPIAPDSGRPMSQDRPRPVLAGAAAMLPLAILMVGSVLASSVADGSSAAGVDSAFAVTVLAVLAAALVSGLSVWLTHSAARMMLTVCGAASAGGTAYILLSQLGVPPLLGAPVMAIVGVAWGRWVFAVFALAPPTRALLLEGIPERDRVVASYARGSGAEGATTKPWSVDVASARMQRLVIYGVVVFGAIFALSWGSVSAWWLTVLGVLGVGFCLVMASWSSVRLSIDDAGLTIRSLRLPITLVRVRAADVLGVGSVEIDPMVWGGWGLRWNARHTAYISSGGPGLIVHRSTGRPLAIETPQGTRTANDGAQRLRQIASAAQSR